jgi:chromosome segregation ATPase
MTTKLNKAKHRLEHLRDDLTTVFVALNAANAATTELRTQLENAQRQVTPQLRIDVDSMKRLHNENRTMREENTRLHAALNEQIAINAKNIDRLAQMSGQPNPDNSPTFAEQLSQAKAENNTLRAEIDAATLRNVLHERAIAKMTADAAERERFISVLNARITELSRAFGTGQGAPSDNVRLGPRPVGQ